MKIALVSCGKRKRAGAHAAKDLYISPLFRMTYRHAETKFDRVFILSAKHGLLDPKKRIRPYDESLRQKTKKERRHWAKRVAREFTSCVPAGSTLYFFCGALYSHGIAREVEKHFRCIFPFRGLSLGRRLRWLKEKTGHSRSKQKESCG